MNIEIRSAEPGDSGRLAGLTVELGYDPSGMEERLTGLLGRDGTAVLVAVAEGGVIGWIHVHDAHLVQAPPFTEVGGLVVADEHRGTGVGERLLGAAEQWAQARGHTRVRIRSNAIRERAHGFYLGHGYRMEKTSLAFTKEI